MAAGGRRKPSPFLMEDEMQIIKKLSEMIAEEIEDADKYARCALNYKATMPELADTFNRLSAEEMKHMQMMHEQVVRIIDNFVIY